MKNQRLNWLSKIKHTPIFEKKVVKNGKISQSVNKKIAKNRIF